MYVWEQKRTSGFNHLLAAMVRREVAEKRNLNGERNKQETGSASKESRRRRMRSKTECGNTFICVNAMRKSWPFYGRCKNPMNLATKFKRIGQHRLFKLIVFLEL